MKKKKKEEQKDQPLLQLLCGEPECEEEDVGFRTITKDLQAYINKIRLERLREFNKYKREELEKEQLEKNAGSIQEVTIGSTKENVGLRKRGFDGNTTYMINEHNIDRFIQLSQY